ncbi:hypothetical protein D3C79_659840 [compost metagenome]
MDQEEGRVDALSMDKTLRRRGDEGSITSPALPFVHAGGPIVAIGQGIQIASACGEQDAVSDELGRNVERINESSNEVAIGADHTARACLELSQLAAGLRQTIGRFRLA